VSESASDFQKKETRCNVVREHPRDGDIPETREVDAIESVASLLDRMRTGDRAAAAEFMDRFASRIRRRVRGRLRPAMRRLFDSQEILSTLARRLDLFVLGGKLTAASEAQLWSLVFTMAQNAVVDKARLFSRLRAAENSDDFAHHLDERLENAERTKEDGATFELDRVFTALEDRTDREILSLWLHDTPHNMTAQLVGLKPDAVRQRWLSIRRKLQPVLVPKEL
jgi:RNA polymerase sigma-70 factor (ECF subfamily)